VPRWMVAAAGVAADVVLLWLPLRAYEGEPAMHDLAWVCEGEGGVARQLLGEACCAWEEGVAVVNERGYCMGGKEQEALGWEQKEREEEVARKAEA